MNIRKFRFICKISLEEGVLLFHFAIGEIQLREYSVNKIEKG